MKALFWNLKRREATLDFVADLVREHAVDLVLLAEKPEIDGGEIARYLNERLVTDVFSDALRPPRSRICAISRLPHAQFHTAQNDENFPYATLYRLGGCTLVVAHLVSKSFAEDIDREEGASDLGDLIRRYEDAQDPQRRTLLVGDLNMDPFEAGMVKATGLHALADRVTVRRGSRIVKGVEYPYFYNAMWGMWGDVMMGPPGTYFFNNSGHHINRFWHMLDQVLVRPVLVDALTDIQIVDAVAGRPLASADGHPSASDHFPLLFTLELPDV